VAAVAVAATLLAAGAAHSAPAPAPAPAVVRFAVFAFEGFDLPPALEMTPVSVAEAVSWTLAGAGHTVIDPPLTLRDMIVALDCKAVDGPCAVKMGKNLGVDRVVVGKLYGADGGVLVRLRAFDCKDGAILFESDEKTRADAGSIAAASNRAATALAVARRGGAKSAPLAPHAGAASVGLLAAGGALLAGGLATAVGLGATVASIRGAGTPTTAGDFDAIQRRIEGGHRLVVATVVLGAAGLGVFGAGLVLFAGERKHGGGAVALLACLAPGGGPALALRFTGFLR
jgi:hypothetical protein